MPYNLPHLDCTTEQRRVSLCNQYIIHANACITLYNGDIVKSDANNRTIYDHYYQFSCHTRKNDGTENEVSYILTVGETAARHLCSLTKEQLPSSFNPYIGEPGASEGNGGGNNDSAWNPLRRSFYYAVQLFIMRYQNSLVPGTAIFKLLNNISSSKYLGYPPQDFQFEKFMGIVSKYKTSMPKIIGELSQHKEIRNFNFTALANEAEKYITDEIYNVFR